MTTSRARVGSLTENRQPPRSTLKVLGMPTDKDRLPPPPKVDYLPPTRYIENPLDGHMEDVVDLVENPIRQIRCKTAPPFQLSQRGMLEISESVARLFVRVLRRKRRRRFRAKAKRKAAL